MQIIQRVQAQCFHRLVSYPDPPCRKCLSLTLRQDVFIAYSINTTTGRSVYTVSENHLRHGRSGYETIYRRLQVSN